MTKRVTVAGGSKGPVPAQANAAPAGGSTAMDRRSWYMPKASADALAELVDDLHWETRRPKQEILAAVVAEVLARRAQVERRLRKS
ncbi:hypothetical protein ACFVXG_20355 [Kitasatospora sp. NPDC058162]|uniref:hypothetical protein n=1 Tax=Kitasatospora sp. NPDC058162 TaxID=3346362 RepID=UPI0036DA3A76